MKLKAIFRFLFAPRWPPRSIPPRAGQQPGPVIYQPDFVGEGRIFMVALSVPTAHPRSRWSARRP